MKKIILKLITSLAIVLSFTSLCFGQSKELTFTKDGSSYKCNGIARSCYFIFDNEPEEYKVNGKAVPHSYFIHNYFEIDGSEEIVIDGATPKEVHFYDGTDTPSFVQKWEEPTDKADLLLISSHADDEQLFFAGVLPYYSKVRGLNVQVAYATDHVNDLRRHHERLNGLWAVGIKNYPVSSGYADLYSETYEAALSQLNAYGIFEDAIISWEKELLNRFSPKVVVTHDLNGEYSHGMHKLVSGTLTKALENAKIEFPFLKRVFLHLYNENQISLDVIDQSFEELEGLTPFQVTQKEGFPCHDSQQWTWFYKWINGANGEISAASQIKTYSPLLYGCYYSDEDFSGDEFFADLTSYEEDRIAEELLLKQKLEEEQRLKEEQEQLAQKKNRKMTIIYCCAVAIGLILIIVFIPKKKYKGKH